MTTSISTTITEAGATNPPGAAQAGLAALFDALASVTGGPRAAATGDGATSVQPADFSQLLNAPASATKAPAETASPVAAAVTPLTSRVTAAAALVSATIGREETSEAEGADPVAATSGSKLTRDDLEAVAALLVTLLPALTAVQQALPIVSAGGEAGTSALPTDSAAARPLQISVKLSGMPPFAVQLPAGASESEVATALETALAEARKPVASDATSSVPAPSEAAETQAEQSGADFIVEVPARAAPATASVPITISLPGRWAQKSAPEKIAARLDAKSPVAAAKKIPLEKNFLSAENEVVKNGETAAGIGVAETAPSMPVFNTVRRLPLDEPDISPVGRMPESLPQFAPSASVSELVPAAVSTEASASALAHRAVEVVLKVVEAQQSPTASQSVVKLHFKFGGDDLAVRVQLSGGVVHTQFSTDSDALRAVLSAEWRATVGPGNGAAGLRLIEPVFAPGHSSNASGFGAASSGQQFSSSQQHSQPQDQQSAAPAWPGRRGLHRGAAVARIAAADTPRAATVSPTSLHLAAVA